MNEQKQQIDKYETFLTRKLQPDLKKVLDERDKVYEDTADLKLLNQIALIKDNGKNGSPLKTLVDVGCDFYMQAKVANTNLINVFVGLDCHVEFTLDEAVVFIKKKEKYLEKKAEALTDRALKIKAQIKLVLAAIQEVLES
ncbi:UNVERIFIED_CONTAM: hypothetical protein HDU68_006818 [Siphonaria sp. JEL0065]|nr:hypothetical protein HDU68_006818 [Siphonaria sp. JEL0065]